MENQVTKYSPAELIPPEELPKTRQQAVSLLKTSPMLYWDSLRPTSVRDVFDAPLSLVDIKRECGEMKLQALMVKWMNSFLRFYSVNGAMDAVQVADTINLIIETYPHYKQEDFKLFFNMAKKGMFGQIYGRMDGEVVMNWLAKYDIHRDTVAQTDSINEAARFKERSPVTPTQGVYYDEYMRIKRRAESGDEEARRMLAPPPGDGR